MLISDSDSLATFCQALSDAPYIAVDTEFVRERTYYAELALIQVAHGDHAAAIDPLAEGIDLAPLKALLLNPGIVTVFHSGTEDLELLLQLFGELPTPLFDTQVAASLCGSDAQIGYARLVNQRLGITLDKAHQRTNWARRPLSDAQLAYALADVTHLCTLYDLLIEDLTTRGRLSWINEDMATLSNTRRYEVDPYEAWRRVRIHRTKRRSLAILRELAAWREVTAQKRNLPRPWVLKNDALTQLAEAAPRSRDAILRLSAVQKMGSRWRDADRVLKVIEKGLAVPESDWPELPDRIQTPGEEKLLKTLRALLKTRCEKAEVAPTVVATRRDLELLVIHDEPEIAAMTGWRRALFGDAALAAKQGR